MNKYKIIRGYFRGGKRTIATGLTLDEAQAHCRDPETSSRTATSAAAPELLALLKDACASLEVQAATARHYAEAGVNTTANKNLADEIARSCEAYRAAIAKATGANQ
jgi:hypothetical protein